MKIYNAIRVSALCCLAAAALGQQDTSTGLRGTVLDPSGASVPGAVVQLRSQGGELRKTTDEKGQYAFTGLPPGKYEVHVTAKGFNPVDKPEFDIKGSAVFDARLSIRTQTETVNVDDASHAVSADPANNGGALILREKELAALSDDPDELSQQLQAMAGPGAGPGGAQIYIDGFTGGEMPPKASIREIRINSNPFSAEYDRPGFGRIEILTKPGSDKFHGQAFFQYNDQNFNSRSPLLTSALPPYNQRFVGGSFGGPLKTGKASFNLDFERRDITENAFILATVLDSNLLPSTVNKAVTTPQTRTSLSPRLDYSINSSNTLTLRYQFTQNTRDKQGIGNYSLESQAFNTSSTEHTFQATESAILSANAVNETRFQFLRSDSINSGAGTQPAVNVQGAFTGGSATTGNSGTLTTNYELSNNTTWTKGTHMVKTGFRFRASLLDSSSYNNFNGSFTFLGGSGPELDANNNPVAGTSVVLSALQVYQRTLLFQGLGYTDAQIRALGGGASQFSIGAGTASTAVNQYDLGFYANDDWRMRPNLTLSYGLRYETQNNISDHLNFAPRVGIAWGIDSKGGKAGKTVLRAGIGLFYDRVAESYTLNALRYNGSTQESYVVMNPSFYPNIPTLSSLAASKQPQRLQPLYGGISAPQNWQANIGIDRQINSYFRVSANYITSRGIHLLNFRDVNAPVNGVYPYGDTQIRLLTESAGTSRSNQLFIGPNLSYRKLFLFGFYSLSYGKDNNEGQPADPYNLKAEWGRSTFADVRHRAIIGTNIPMPWKVSVSPFMMFSSGTPYNITTGSDPYLIGTATVRPSLVIGATAASCTGPNLRYEADFGCFNLNPASGTAIARNYATGPGVVSINLRLARTWSFGNKTEAIQDAGIGPGGPPPGGGGPPPGGGGGPPPGGGPGGGGPGAMFGVAGGKKYNLTLGVVANNAINHANYAAPSGDLSSPFFGQYRSLTGGFGLAGGGSSSYDRKITLQLRLSF